MARNVGTTVVPEITLHIDTIKADGTVEERLIKIEDMVKELRYAADGKVNVVSGRVADITYKVEKTKRLYTSVAKAKSWFRYDVKPENIIIDTSTAFHSNLHVIPIKELLENEGTTNVKRLNFYLSYGIKVEVVRSDDLVNTFELKEGDILKDVCYLFKGDETVLPDAKLIAIKRNGVTLNPSSLILNLNNKLREIPIMQLVNVGTAAKPITTAGSIMDSIKDTPDEQTLFLSEGTFVEKLSISNNVVIRGNKAGIWGTSKNRDKENFEGETVLTGSIAVTKNAKITLDGLVLTKDAIISFTDNAEVTVHNCIVRDMIATTAKEHLIKGWTNTPVKIDVQNCYFGKSDKSAKGVIYHITELTCQLRDGTIFANNYFEKGCNTHNSINLYGAVDGATITIEKNTWEHSGNAIRVGFKGSPKCTVNVNSNTYLATDELDGGKWAGLMIIQPYAHDTVSLADVRININKTVHKDPYHIYYNFTTTTGSGGLVLTEENAPQIYINGKKEPVLNNHLKI